jgi:hypothetical protein
MHEDSEIMDDVIVRYEKDDIFGIIIMDASKNWSR